MFEGTNLCSLQANEYCWKLSYLQHWFNFFFFTYAWAIKKSPFCQSTEILSSTISRRVPSKIPNTYHDIDEGRAYSTTKISTDKQSKSGYQTKELINVNMLIFFETLLKIFICNNINMYIYKHIFLPEAQHWKICDVYVLFFYVFCLIFWNVED